MASEKQPLQRKRAQKQPPPGVSVAPDPALKPFERNLLRNPNPEGVNISEPAPLLTLPRAAWNPLDPKGIFKGWQVSIEPLESDKAEVAPKSVLPRYSWCVKQQHIDLVAEGFWEELLDSYQPNFTVMDWYENSKLANSVYELHVRLLGADRATVLGEFHHVAHEGEQDRQENKNWHHVSHVFQRYGAGLRYVHFLHKAKEVETPAGFLRTRVTDSSVSAQLRD
uniref:F-box only protein 50 n=1 Tax=Podarcis muralis TaxID=64176 RepID=UPI00109F510A|nr:F-box only protein 50 [Podarcis muralis]